MKVSQEDVLAAKKRINEMRRKYYGTEKSPIAA